MARRGRFSPFWYSGSWDPNTKRVRAGGSADEGCRREGSADGKVVQMEARGRRGVGGRGQVEGQVGGRRQGERLTVRGSIATPAASKGILSSTVTRRHAPWSKSLTAYLPLGTCRGRPSVCGWISSQRKHPSSTWAGCSATSWMHEIIHCSARRASATAAPSPSAMCGTDSIRLGSSRLTGAGSAPSSTSATTGGSTT